MEEKIMKMLWAIFLFMVLFAIVVIVLLLEYLPNEIIERLINELSQ